MRVAPATGRKPRKDYFGALVAGAAGAGIAAGTPAGTEAAGATVPGITAAGAGALAAGAARSSTLPLLSGKLPRPRLELKASAKVQAKNTAAAAAVERDRKFALPLAPNKLPEAPLPKDAPMSAPLPCWISTRPIIAMAASSCTA